jgi:hypothetical protein
VQNFAIYGNSLSLVFSMVWGINAKARHKHAIQKTYAQILPSNLDFSNPVRPDDR